MVKVKGLGGDEKETGCKVVKTDGLGGIPKACINCDRQQRARGDYLPVIKIGSLLSGGGGGVEAVLMVAVLLPLILRAPNCLPLHCKPTFFVLKKHSI